MKFGAMGARGGFGALGSLGRVGGGGGSSLIAIGSQIGFWGDGVFGTGCTAGLRRATDMALILLNLRVIPGPGYQQCISGSTMDTVYDRKELAANQCWKIAVYSNDGHNDALMSTDPDLDATQWTKWKRNFDWWRQNNSRASLIPVCTTVKSTVVAEGNTASVGGMTIAQRVNQLQKAYITAAAALDARILLIDTFTVYDPLNMSSDSGAFYTHPDVRGGYALGSYIAAAISPYIVAGTKDEVQALLLAGTYPGMTGTQFDTDVLMAVDGGTATNITGTWTSGKRAVNNLAGTASVAASKDTSPGTYTKRILTISGTPGAENTIVEDDTGNITATGTTPGGHVMCTWGFKIHDGSNGAPVGFRNIGVTWGNFGLFGTSGTDGTSQTLAQKLEGIIATAPLGGFASNGPYAANPAFATRWANASLTGVVEIDRPMMHIVTTLDAGPAAYIGWDTVLGANYKIRLSGTIAALRAETGQWTPYGMGNSNFTARRIYLGGTAGGTKSDSGIGTGTLLATLSGSTWTYNASGDGLTAGVSQLYLEVDGISSTGSTFTARSSSAFVPSS